MNLLEANHITKRYTGHTALDDVTIHFPEGSVFGLLGPNGAGKTTLIRIITQITAPDSGQLIYRGSPLKRSDIHHMGYLPEERGLYKKMKVGEQALYLSQLKGLDHHTALERLKTWFRKFEITGWWDKKVEELSKGMAQKVQFITTILHEPKFLILDEPFSGFDPINAELIKQEILELKRKGTTIVLSTHNMGSVEEICDQVALINKSKKLLDGPVTEIRKKYSTNTFRIEYQGVAEKLQDAISGRFEVLENHVEKHSQAALIDIGKENRLNDLLSALIPAVDIVSAHEKIPTMNDIFIRVVTNHSHE